MKLSRWSKLLPSKDKIFYGSVFWFANEKILLFDSLKQLQNQLFRSKKIDARKIERSLYWPLVIWHNFGHFDCITNLEFRSFWWFYSFWLTDANWSICTLHFYANVTCHTQLASVILSNEFAFENYRTFLCRFIDIK